MTEKYIEREQEIIDAMVDIFDETKKLAYNKFIKFIQNKDIPLGNRWDCYLKHGEKMLQSGIVTDETDKEAWMQKGVWKID